MLDLSIMEVFHTLLNFNLHCGFSFLQGAVKRMAIGNALTAINQLIKYIDSVHFSLFYKSIRCEGYIARSLLETP